MGTLLMWQCKIITYSLRGQAEGCVKWGNIHVHVFIHPASLCLFFGAFNPFLFKVMVDMYVFITIFLIVLGLFSVGLFLFLLFLLRVVPLMFVVKLVWWCWILLTFACLESFWFLHQIWLRVLLGRAFLVASSRDRVLRWAHSLSNKGKETEQEKYGLAFSACSAGPWELEGGGSGHALWAHPWASLS